jgi:hypothetical protein
MEKCYINVWAAFELHRKGAISEQELVEAIDYALANSNDAATRNFANNLFQLLKH